MITLEEVTERLNRGREVFKKYRLTEIGIFGSYVRNEQSEESDVDILIDYEPEGMSIFRFLDLQEELSNIVGIKIDLVPKRDLKEHIGKRILNEVQYIWNENM